MPSENIKRKPCECPSDSYEWVQKTYEKTEGPYRIIHVFEIKECALHKTTWGRRRKEEKIITCKTPIEKYNVEENDLAFFRSIISKLWNDKINEYKWKKKLKKYYNNQNLDEISNGLIQKGLIFKKIEVIQASNTEKTYYSLTDNGKLKLKKLTAFLNIEEKIDLGIKKIKNTLDLFNYDDLKENKKIIFSLVENQLGLLKRRNPEWIKNDGTSIKPQNSAINPPKYLIILYGLCTWLQIYRDNLTLREVSARAFQDSQLLSDVDPSKVLDKYSNDFNSIIKQFSGKDSNDFGLILALDSFTFSGKLILKIQNGNSIKIAGSSVSFSNLSYSNIKTINLNVEKVLFIENFAVYAQMVLDNWGADNNTLLIFIKGMGISGYFKKSILKKIIRNNPEANYFVWLDYDLGGCKIYREILKNLNVDNIKIIKIPP
ncbi:MAG: hypothetical protein ACFFG0_27360, partial [Candidatus Thorarchaeota archaeon]